MRISLACLVALCALPAGVMAQDASVHDKPAVRGSIIANLLQDHDNPFLLHLAQLESALCPPDGAKR